MAKYLIQIAAAAALCAAAVGFDALQTPTTYACTLSGEPFHYQNGVRAEAPGDVTLRFKLLIKPWSDTYEIADTIQLPEHQAKSIRLDYSRSNPVDVYYVSDAVDKRTGIRNVSSLVINTVSGDTRIFHHTWMPPNGWENSVQYSYVGNCKKAGL
jgi:hypothetical protein